MPAGGQRKERLRALTALCAGDATRRRPMPTVHSSCRGRGEQRHHAGSASGNYHALSWCLARLGLYAFDGAGNVS